MKKVILWIFVLCAAASTTLTIIRWNVWFGNRPEAHYTISQSITNVQLSFGETNKDLIISWRSRVDSTLLMPNAINITFKRIQHNNDSCQDKLYYGKINHKKITTEGGKTTFFWCNIKLDEGQYKYAIIAPDTMSQWYETEVYNNYNQEFTALVFGDIQDKKQSGTDTLITELSSLYSPNFILQLGDLIERPHQNYWQLYFDTFAPFCSSTPMIVVAGNHDYIKGINKHIEERFFYTFPSPTTKTYNFGNVALITLDSNQPLHKLWNQRKFLRNALTENANKEFRIVAFHHPMHSAKGYFNNLFIRLFFQPIINKGKVQLVLNGHEHTLLHLTPEETHGTYHQIISHFSEKDYSTSKGISNRHYILLKYKDNELTVSIKNTKHQTIKTIII